MESIERQHLDTLKHELDALVETSEQLVKNAVLAHRQKDKIKMMETPHLWGQDELYEKKIIFVGMRQREILNAFREVRIRLLQRNGSDNMVVMVSSVAPSHSTSNFCFNLAATFALDPHKTALYVDCNPYETEADKFLISKASAGLSDFLTDYSIALKDIIHPTGVERVRLIPAGAFSDSAAEAFNSARMEALVAELKSRYPDRFIVIDAPSVQQSTEARIIANYCDHALLVVPFGKVVTDEVLSAVDAVGKEKFAGVVFNN